MAQMQGTARMQGMAPTAEYARPIARTKSVGATGVAISAARVAPLPHSVAMANASPTVRPTAPDWSVEMMAAAVRVGPVVRMRHA